jgi:cold shock CspA family protein
MSLVTGVVSHFDAARGDGEILTDDGVALYFHCVAIADGSRQIEPGTRVSARRRVGLVGRDEVIDVQSMGG